MLICCVLFYVCYNPRVPSPSMETFLKNSVKLHWRASGRALLRCSLPLMSQPVDWTSLKLTWWFSVPHPRYVLLYAWFCRVFNVTTVGRNKQKKTCTGSWFEFTSYVCLHLKDVESYIHRSGRTGRAGRTGVCICFYQRKEEDQLRYVENKAVCFGEPHLIVHLT